MIKRLLVANRGEIACRVFKTARAKGITCLAVYAPSDRHSPHIEQADEAICLPAGPLSQNYLSIEAMLAAAKQLHADAIHPGYGFLSENPAFAEQCQAAGIIFVGPSADSMRLMALKNEAKAFMEKAGLPVLPGYNGQDQSENILIAEAKKIGYPLLIKASAGGGGRGMRIVHEDNGLLEAIRSARQEAEKSFSNPHLILERYFPSVRHIEVQVFGDQHGNVVHLFERDCSLQRRHQKVIEEAPASSLSDKAKAVLYQAATDACHALGYIGAGTLEFLVTPEESVYFLEMNTRLQVEHPVTEMVTGEDLVAWQLSIAQGEPLPKKQSQITCQGHAFEARLYAEDPSHNFLPATGQVEILHLPRDDTARFELGIKQGSIIGIAFDPMLMKVVISASNRAAALQKLLSTLSEMEIVGVTTNLPFLRRLTDSISQQKSPPNTHFIHEHLSTLLASPSIKESLWLTAVAVYHQTQRPAATPWHDCTALRLNHVASSSLWIEHRENTYQLQLTQLGPILSVRSGDMQYETQGDYQNAHLRWQVEGCWHEALVLEGTDYTRFVIQGQNIDIVFAHQRQITTVDTEQALCAPMPGIVSQLRVQSGDIVSSGEVLLVIEAMKMEHSIVANANGTVDALYCKEGEQVSPQQQLVSIIEND